MTAHGFTDSDLEELQRATFRYFWTEANPANGLIADNTAPGEVPASIAGCGMALSTYVVAAARGFAPRAQIAERVSTMLRFFHDAPSGVDPDATGYKGFYYHFLNVETGRRAWRCELSTIDSAILLAGALTAARYFDADTPVESGIREIADALYRRVDWRWALNGGAAVSHGWEPERGFLRYRWTGYNEALLLYVLGLGSPTHALPEESYRAWEATYRWKKLYGIELLYAGPLFIHQMSHMWVDLRGVRDRFMREQGIDYFENSRRASYVQREYAARNPRGFEGYGKACWGITAASGPGPATRTIDGVRRSFYGYVARGAPFGPDDGTIAPWATVASLPFAPEIVLPALQHFRERYPEMITDKGLTCSFNPSFPDDSAEHGWVSGGYYALDQGPVVVMIENYRSGLVWRLMRRCPYVVAGLRRAGFEGGWLGKNDSYACGGPTAVPGAPPRSGRAW
jgi:hypothetical protein